jgi:hypothetical protein
MSMLDLAANRIISERVGRQLGPVGRLAFVSEDLAPMVICRCGAVFANPKLKGAHARRSPGCAYTAEEVREKCRNLAERRRRARGYLPRRSRDVRFWEKVDRSGECWVWTGRRTPRGYGEFGLHKPGRSSRAHRVAWELTHGPIPDGMCICHACDNPPCCNPAHLFLGTSADNTRDMDEKGRRVVGLRPVYPTGETHPMAKLNSAQVAEMRALRSNGWGERQLAARFGVGHSQVHRIVSGQSWVSVQVRRVP